ncbi:hypothetical protein L593_07860 [Salinarchaeum sp. Harcht-Bsk1]|uniref:helix-turn-helix transcriptional regulator n=1 Tax=Salinarchaeum sp. Harcht-Bsk1 TaxID=1333523 RepID=UPI0003422DE5|nr:hypothetical protein [Salinarchaeum sp. Harcht-Bsk1]AGN01517.1 hypothetical protein L593_07860 [Salinarchaeum sp. Harcht-Bsk1]
MELRRGTVRRAAAIALTALLLASLLPGLAVGDATTGTTTAGATTAETGPLASTNASTAIQEVDADRTRIRIDLQEDGDATWTVELWTRLEDDADEEAFASLEADVRNDSESYTADFRSRMNGSVTAASDATGREMTIEGLTVSTRTEGVPSSYGVLAYEFEWTNFAVVDGQELHAGAAIDGFLMEQHTRLTISWPEGYRTASVEPSPNDRTDSAAIWQGSETDFVAGQPRLVVTSAAAEDDSLLPLVGAAVLLAAIVALVGYLAWSGHLSLPGSSGREADGEVAIADSGGAGAASASAGAGAAPTDDDSSHEATGASEAPSDADGAAEEQPGDGEPTAEADEPAEDEADVPPELLSNEEQVLRLLEGHGGRMKQQQVVSELEWTEAKTSQVVTGMREDDRIEVFRIGRENVLALPGEADL